MSKALSRKELAKDALALVLALGLPVLAADLNVWGFFVDICAVVPFVWIGVRRGKAAAIGLALLAVVGVYLVSRNLVLTLGNGMVLLGVSLSFVLGLERGWKPGKMLFWGSLMWIPFVVLSIGSVGQDWLTQLQNAYLEMFQQSDMQQMLISSQGLGASQTQDWLQKVSWIAAAIYPAILYLYGLVTMVVNFLLVKAVMKRGMGLGLEIGPFMRWTLPWYAVWGAIAGLAAYLAGDNWNLTWLIVVGINLGLVYAVICLVLGLSVAIHLFVSPRIPFLLKIIFVILVLINPLILSLLGLFDMVMNFRKIPESA